jgi:hypothetical protein
LTPAIDTVPATQLLIAGGGDIAPASQAQVTDVCIEVRARNPLVA